MIDYEGLACGEVLGWGLIMGVWGCVVVRLCNSSGGSGGSSSSSGSGSSFSSRPSYWSDV